MALQQAATTPSAAPPRPGTSDADASARSVGAALEACDEKAAMAVSSSGDESRCHGPDAARTGCRQDDMGGDGFLGAPRPPPSPPPRPPAGLWRRLRALNARIEGLAGFEARGIARVPASERRAPSRGDDVQVAVMWFSANMSLNNLAAAMMGPLVLELGFLDCALLAVLGALVGSLTTAYMAIWGPQSGNRTMVPPPPPALRLAGRLTGGAQVVLRFFMGYWPAKVPCLLNVVLMVGYATIDAIIGGQVLSAVSGGQMTMAVGIVVVSAVCWVVAVFGMALFHKYERSVGPSPNPSPSMGDASAADNGPRANHPPSLCARAASRYSWLPQVVALFVLVGVAGPYFDASARSKASGGLVAAQRLSFFNICLYVPNSWAAAACDFYVYYPEKTSRRKIFVLTLAGMWSAFCLVYLVGVGLATGVARIPAWAAANDVSTGALVVAGYAPLGGFGRVCAVVVALGVIANATPSTYSAALGCQTLGGGAKAVPRWLWSTLLVLVEVVLAVAGREHLFAVFQNFVALMGYWVMIVVAIIAAEHLLFLGRAARPPLDWSRGEDRAYLPLGCAAGAAFAVGWAGAVLGMSQAWYVGPLARVASTADVGLWLAVAFAVAAYAPLRVVERRLAGR